MSHCSTGWRITNVRYGWIPGWGKQRLGTKFSEGFMSKFNQHSGIKLCWCILFDSMFLPWWFIVESYLFLLVFWKVLSVVLYRDTWKFFARKFTMSSSIFKIISIIQHFASIVGHFSRSCFVLSESGFGYFFLFICPASNLLVVSTLVIVVFNDHFYLHNMTCTIYAFPQRW